MTGEREAQLRDKAEARERLTQWLAENDRQFPSQTDFDDNVSTLYPSGAGAAVHLLASDLRLLLASGSEPSTAAAERARVVAFIRDRSAGEFDSVLLWSIAASIERGEHFATPVPSPEQETP